MRKCIGLVLLVFLVACGGSASFQKYSASDVTKQLQAQGLAISDIKPDQRDPNSQAPNVAVEDMNFTIASITPKGGHVLIFKEQKDLDAMKAWYARFPDLAPYVYTNGNAMLQLNSGLPKLEADKFKAALETV